MLLHDIASSSVTFHHVIPLLECTHRCIAIDLPGFGESPAPEPSGALPGPTGLRPWAGSQHF
ncbi:alpha/beta fold hydrolase [Enemella dayhoffiae]|uniref:alpha/beta fold hydrolase n=1 Tax=Enemella dayhoffiae TaxID=2016507 RepID=UPI00113FDCBE|nr:alpha/beta fold hydrolase [Enemella dayhoffiae]